MNSDARERVGKAIRDARTMDEYHAGDIDMGHLTDAAIAEYNAHLWSRADDPEVVEAVAKATWDSSPENARWDDVRKRRVWDIATDPMLSDAKAAITALLTALIGPRPQGESDER